MKGISRRRSAVVTTVVLMAVALGVLALVKFRQHQQSLARGSALFNGQVALVGRITGQSDPLPTAATRCVNCHAARGDGATKNGSIAAYAVSLNRAALTEPRSRRGGPASRFKQASLCALVRSGIDPTYIIIPQAMPRYDLTDQDCSALWDYLQTL